MAAVINKIENNNQIEKKAVLEGKSLPNDLLLTNAIALPVIRQTSIKPAVNPSMICQVLDVEGDSFYLAQSVTNLWDAIYGKNSNLKPNTLGLLSIYTIYTGYLRAAEGFEGYKESKKIGDRAGQAVGALHGLRGPIEILRGCSNVCAGVLSTLATYTACKGALAPALALKGVSYGFSGLIYLLLLIPSLITLVKNEQFGRKWHRAMAREKGTRDKISAGLQTLIEELEGSEQEKEAFLRKIVEKREIWDEKGAQVVAPELSPYPREPLEQKEAAFLLREAIKHTSNPECARRLYGHFYQEYFHFKATKEADFIRKIGLRSLEALRNYLNEEFVGDAEDPKGIEKGQEVIAHVKSEITKNKVLHFAIIFFSSLGIGIVIASGLGGAGIVLPIAWIVLSLGMFAIDWHFLSEKLQLDKKDHGDEKRLFIANAFLMIVVGVVVSLGGSLAPLAIESLWISGLVLYSIYQCKMQREDKVSLICI